MNKTIKRNVIVSAILVIMLCVSMIAGATFALFTSESKVNIAVTSGKVNVVASIDTDSVETKALGGDYAKGNDNTFEAGVNFDDNGVTLENFVPGDGIKFNIVVKNESTVSVKYRTIISCDDDNEEGLFKGLNITIKGENYNSANVVSTWAELAVGSDDTIVPVTIELPENAGNEYQGKTCTISYKVEAVQGNADTIDVNNDGTTIAEKNIKDDNGNEATVFAGTKIQAGQIGVSLEIEELAEDKANTGNFEFATTDNTVVKAFGVSVPEVADENNVAVKVTMNAPKNLSGVVLFHEGVPMNEVESAEIVKNHHEFFYDAENGKITFATKNFSNFTLVSGLENVVFVSDADELFAALEAENNKEVVLSNNIEINASLSNAYGKTAINILNNQTLNGCGYTLNVKGANGTWDSAINITGGTIKNLTVTGSFRGIFINHNSVVSDKVFLENVIINGPIYTISCDQGTNSGLEAKNCEFYGWTSFAATLGEAIFEDCIFGAGSGYNFSRPYASTLYINCEFKAGHEMDAREKVVLYGCTLNGVDITNDNLGNLVVSNTANAVVPTAISTADGLKTALAEGGSYMLAENLEINEKITIANGVEAVLFMNGKTITSTFNNTGNQEMFIVKGKLTVMDGTINMTAENNQGWNAMATIFDVTSGGILNLKGVNASVSGTDMNFIVHLNNWGTATADIDNCNFNLSYVAVRVFNSGYDMNTVTIKNTNVTEGKLFWVHNYTSEGKDDSTLDLDIYNNNTCDHVTPIRFGFSNSTYYDINGNAIDANGNVIE